ncbi:MAG: CRISPR-associated endonuclease Cas3'', partial [Comamonadaceae bacterium]|nr:CRISPR-associated endonuclease Cas3'' [Comamonadaceae bacterium]
MNVLFVAQCTKNALTETRRILDQFAERRGERTWQTPITQAGLDTVRKLLRQSARKNTAVACHWIRGRDHSELLWVVGDARQFNDQGAVPTHTTARNVLRTEDENAWHHLPLMTALAALAALLHDLGKATQAFQDRLRNPGLRERNHYRHEWVSVRLFQAFVGGDGDAAWLQRLATCADEPEADAKSFEALWLDHADGRLLRDGLDEPQAAQHLPFAQLPPLAQAVAWLVFTHHRLPCLPVKQPDGSIDEDMDTPRAE